MSSGDRLQSNGYIGATMPWAYSSNREPAQPMSGIRYRGWTLVDMGIWRYAAKDNSLTRVKVCRTHTSHAKAVRRFHEIVDEWEGEE